MRTLTALFALFAAFFATALAAQPQRTFVSAKNGNDANACSLISPCRNLQRGVDAVASGGEVIPLDSGGYGTLLIQKPVTIAAPAGVHVGVTTTSPTQQYAITIRTAGSVSLRGISVSNLGGWGGIVSLGSSTLRVDSCTVDGGQYSGINLNALAQYSLPGGILIVTDTTITRNGSYAILVRGTDVTHRVIASVDRVRVSGNGTGIGASNNSDLTVRNSVIFNNSVGVKAITTSGTEVARMTVDRSMIIGNITGVLSDPPFGSPDAGIMRISNSVIAYNTWRGIWIGNGHIYSRGDNTVVGNAADEVFPETYAAK